MNRKQRAAKRVGREQDKEYQRKVRKNRTTVKAFIHGRDESRGEVESVFNGRTKAIHHQDSDVLPIA